MSQVFHDLTEYPIAETTRKVYRHYLDRLAALAARERTIYGYRDAAWISTMSDGLLRISEVAAIDVAHVDFGNNTLFIPRSKTDQTGKGAVLYLGDKTLGYIKQWMEKSKVKDGPLFRPIHRDFLRALKRPLGTWAFRKILKQRCKDAGIDGRISGHSPRVGSAQSLAARQATLVEMQQVGRWTSPNMPAHYARKFAAQQSRARLLASDTVVDPEPTATIKGGRPPWTDPPFHLPSTGARRRPGRPGCPRTAFPLSTLLPLTDGGESVV